jgi:L-ascorbate metabolism protein UlaG (beta-lactamase superfamily)
MAAMSLQRLLPRFHPRREHRPTGSRPNGDSLLVRWLGTAGHVVASRTTTLLIDPFLTRPTPRQLLGKIPPDTSLHARWLPDRVDAVLLGHSHYDHLLDAPSIAKRYAARFVGSATSASFARAGGVPEERIEVVPPEGRTLEIGDFTITFVPSLHGRILFGKVPLPGEVRSPPALPATFLDYLMGGAFGILMQSGERSLYHNGSADLIDAGLEGKAADVLLVGLAGRRGTRDYLRRLTSLLSPQVVIPTHHDAFFGPLELGERLLPGIDMDGFYSEIHDLAPAARVVTPLYHDDVWLPPRGDARDVVVAPRG